MRFSRSSFSSFTSNLEEESREVETEHEELGGPVAIPAEPQMISSEVEGGDEGPIWQRAFVLGPNVRFTRTPDTAMPKRTAAAPTIDTGAISASSHVPGVPAVASSAIPPPVAKSGAERLIAQQQSLPQPPDAKGAHAQQPPTAHTFPKLGTRGARNRGRTDGALQRSDELRRSQGGAN